MTDFDRPAFAEAMHLLGETFGEPLSDIRTEAYFDALKDLSLARVNEGVRATVRTCRFFPKPVDIREAVEGRASDNADTAWGELIQQVQRVGYMGVPTFSDPRILEAIRQVWGGWRALCETLPAEGPELVGWIKQFKSTFETVERHEAHHRLEMGGLHPDVREFLQREAAKHAFPRPKH